MTNYRIKLAALLAALLMVFGATLVVPSVAEAHGGDGRRAPCAVPRARSATWGCGSAWTSGPFIYANVTDKHNDGHCIRILASHTNSSSAFRVGSVCPLGGNHQRALVLNVSGRWNRVWITNGHRIMTLCGRGSGRTC